MIAAIATSVAIEQGDIGVATIATIAELDESHDSIVRQSVGAS